jgi:hypothetical protein
MTMPTLAELEKLGQTTDAENEEMPRAMIAAEKRRSDRTAHAAINGAAAKTDAGGRRDCDACARNQ